MVRISAMAVVCLLAGCGGDDSNCDFSKFSGTYTVHFDEQSGGTCGALPDINTFVDAGNEAPDAGCTIAHQSQSDAACAADIDETCDDSGDSLRIREVAHLDAQDDGSSASGTATFTVTQLSTGAAVCVSTYKIKYTKQ